MGTIVKGVMIISGLLIVAGAIRSMTGGEIDEAAAPAVAASTRRPATATPTPEPQARIGDTVQEGNWAYTVTGVERSDVLVWSEFGNETEAIGEWVVVNLTLKNVGNRNFGINLHDFELRATTIRYDPSIKFETLLYISYRKLTDLGAQYPPGVEVQTALVFDVAPGTEGFVLVLKQAANRTIALD